MKGEGEAYGKPTAILSAALAGLLVGTAVPQAIGSESPAPEAVVSGLGFLLGWNFSASTLIVVILEGEEARSAG